MPILERLKDHWFKKFVLHVFTGAVSVIAHYMLMGLLLRQGVGPLVASSVGFSAGAVVRFLTAYLFVFEPEDSWRHALPRFIVSLGIQGTGNAGLLWFFIALQIPIWAAQILATGLMTILNFLMYRVWVFR
jgi:putative flippase GtrA